MFSRNLAFIIGINNYNNGISPLKTAVNDAKKLVEILREKHNYQVWTCLDEVATLNNLNQLLEKTLPEQVSENDRLLFYFAGHGVALNNDNEPAGYLIPQDAYLHDIYSYLPMTKLHDALNELPCRHFLGILDCCFSGAFRWSSTRDLLTTPEVIHKERYDRFITDPAWQIITSSASDQKALDNFKLDTERGKVDNHSPFAAALLAALEGEADTYPPAKNGKAPGDGVITATELYLHLRDTVEIATQECNLRQTPGIWCLNKHDKGEYIFLSPEHELNLPPAPPLDESKNPYRGLKSFDEEHSELFFGRSELVEKLHNFVKTHSLTVVLGASGSGKSSLVKAGLIPNLKKEIEEKWCILSPIRPGETPFQALNNALINAQLAKVELKNEQKNLSKSVAAWVKNNPNCKLLIFIDQSEELITLCDSQNERKEFFQQILAAIDAHRDKLRVVLTLRADFEAQVRDAGLEFVCEKPNLRTKILKQHWQSGRFIVSVMTRAELREAIEKPAQTRVMYFQPNKLVEELIDEVADMPGVLPLLSFALSELYLKYLKRQTKAQYRGITIDRALTQQDYDELGGVMQSLTQKADEEYQKLVEKNPAYEQVIRHVMLRMVALTGGDLARRRVTELELEYPAQKNTLVEEVIERFTTARLLVKGEDSLGNCYVEPAHDELVRGWQKLQTWLTQEKNLSLQRRLTPAALEWKSQENPRFLWNASPYLDVLKEEILNSSKNNWLNEIETEFVRQSIKQRRKNSITRWSWIGTAFVLLSSATGFAINYAIDAQNKFIENSSILAESMFNSGEELDALIKATDTGKALKNTLPFVISDKNRIQVIDTLRKIVYGIKQKNCFITEETDFASVSFSPDGKNIAVLHQDGNIKVWGLNGKLIQKFSAAKASNEDTFRDIRFSSDGYSLISASRKGIQIWQRQPDGHFKLDRRIGDNDGIMTFSFNPKTKMIVTSSLGNQNIIKLRNSDGEVLQTLTGHTDRVNDFDFSPDNQILVSGAAGGEVKLWDLRNYRLLNTIKTNYSVLAVRFIDRKSIAIAGDNKSIELWGINNQLINEFSEKHGGVIRNLALSHDGETLASASDDGTVKLWNLEGRSLKDTFKGHENAVYKVSFRKDNRIIASVDKNLRVIIWQLDNQIPKFNSKTPSFSSDGRIMVTAKDKTIYIWESKNQDNKLNQRFQYKREIPVPHQEEVNQVKVSSDGKLIASASNKGNLNIWDLDGNHIANLNGHKDSITSFSFSHDSKMVASGSMDGTIKLWDINKQSHINMDSESIVTDVHFSPNGKTIASANRDKTVKIWSLNGTLIGSLKNHKEAVISISFSPNSKMIASASENGIITVYKNNQLISNFLAHKDGVRVVKFFPPDGNILISYGSPDQNIKFWSLNGELLHILDTDLDEDDEIRHIDLSLNGKIMALVGYESTVLWDFDLENLLSSSDDWFPNSPQQQNHSSNLSRGSNTKVCQSF